MSTAEYVTIVVLVLAVAQMMFTDRLIPHALRMLAGFSGVAYGYDFWLLWWLMAMTGALAVVFYYVNPQVRFKDRE